MNECPSGEPGQCFCFMYPGDFRIELLCSGRFELHLEKDSWQDLDIWALEMRLYQWAVEEGFLGG